MIKNLQHVAALAALGGAALVGGCGDSEDPASCADAADCADDGCPTDGCPTDGCPTDGCPTDGCPTDGCPTDGCPTDGCPTDGCPTDGCPTGVSGFQSDYAASPDFFTQMSGPVAGGGFHPENQVWYSESLRASIEGGADFVAPEGATAVKAHYSNGSVVSFTVMTKQADGWDDANSNWFYENLDADGAVVASGAMANCIACHEASPGTDYLLATDVN